MSKERKGLVKLANEASRKARDRGPHLTMSSSVADVAGWLQWNDPNGEHTAARRKRAGEDPYTLDEAWDEVAVALDPETGSSEGIGPEIIEAMTRTLFVVSWSDYEEEQGRSYSGQDLMDVAPETPSVVEDIARQLAIAFEETNNGANVTDLYYRAAAADGEKPDTYEFGHYLVMQALGHGVSWFDDHKQFPIKFPNIEAHWDGESLFVSGLRELVTNPKMKDVGDVGDPFGFRASRSSSKKPLYSYFVVTKDNRIRSGWEYENDAKDDKREGDGEGVSGLRVMTRSGAVRKGIDPAVESNWIGAGNKFDRWNRED